MDGWCLPLAVSEVPRASGARVGSRPFESFMQHLRTEIASFVIYGSWAGLVRRNDYPDPGMLHNSPLRYGLYIYNVVNIVIGVRETIHISWACCPFSESDLINMSGFGSSSWCSLRLSHKLNICLLHFTHNTMKFIIYGTGQAERTTTWWFIKKKLLKTFPSLLWIHFLVCFYFFLVPFFFPRLSLVLILY